MEDLNDPEEMILCPYNASHNIRSARMSFHLVKCRKVNGQQRMVPCHFNTTHIVPEPELRYHHKICSDRKKLEPQIVESVFASQTRFPIKKLDYECEENWDDDDAPTYDPVAYVENNDIVREINVESASKRKAFRQNERLRLGAMNNTENRPSSSNNTENRPSSSRSHNKAEVLPPHDEVTEEKKDADFDPEAFKTKLRIGNKMYLQHKSASDN